MYPVINLGFCSLTSWYLLFVLGVCASLYFYIKFLKEWGFSPMRKTYILFIILYLSCFIGARLTSFISEQGGGLSNIQDLFSIGPLTLYGGALLAIPIGIIYSFKNKLDAPTLADSIALCTLVGLFFGRIGCFLNGCDYGKIIDSSYFQWMGVNFPTAEGLRYPTQLIESFSCIIAFCIIYIHRAKLKGITSGIITGVVSIFYGVERFFNELLRDDPRAWIIDGAVSFSQFISILLICFGLVFLYYRIRCSDRRI